MTDYDPKLVERAASVLMRLYESEYSADHLTWRDFADAARAVLDAVAPALMARAEAAESEWDDWKAAAELIEQRAERAEKDALTAYQRGMVAGARQVAEAVEERVSLWPSMAGRTDYREGVSQATAALLTAAREAVAKIEKGGA